MTKEILRIFKIGGNVIDDSRNLESFLESLSKIRGNKILVHGGGRHADKLLVQLGIEPRMHNGRRITDEATLDVVSMVYAGLINKNIVAKLQKYGCNAIGLSGCDANIILSEMRPKEPIYFGFVGDPVSINTELFALLLGRGILPVINSINHDGKGNLLNTNADTVASFIATSMSGIYKTELYLCFEKPGVLEYVNDDKSVIPTINKKMYESLIKEQKLDKGMLPKLENAFKSVGSGVSKVIICSSADAAGIAENNSGKGTTIEL